MADVQTKSVDRTDSIPKSSSVGTLLQLLPKLPNLSDIKIPDVSPKALRNAMEHSKEYGKLITAIKSNADPEKLDNACEFAVKLSIKYGDRITASNIVDALLHSPEKLSKALDMPLNKIEEAQTCIADAIKKSILKESSENHVKINPFTLTALILPNSHLTLIDSKGNYNPSNLDKVANEVTRNILNNPRTQEEFNLRNYAYQQKEIQHQQAVRDMAHQKISQTPMGFLPGPSMRRQSQAHYIADQWSPGMRWGGMIGRRVTEEMNEGYYNTRAQAEQAMGQKVFEEVRSKIHNSFKSLSPEDRENLRIASKVISHTSDKRYSGELRMNDLEQLNNLNEVAKGLIGSNTNTHVNKPAPAHAPQRRTLHEQHSKAVEQVINPEELKWIAQNYPAIKTHGIDIRQFNIYKYAESDGTTSYALTGKNGIGLMSIRNKRLENYILKDVLDKINHS